MPRRLLPIFLLLNCFSAFAGEPILENFSGNFIRSANKVEGVSTKDVNALCLDGGFLYCGAGSKMYVLDTVNPLSPKVRSSVEIYGLIRQIVTQDGYLFAACRESGVWIFDVKDPDNIRVITRYDPIELSTGIEVCGNVLFLGTRQNGVECVDISDIHNPTHIRIEKTEESQSVTYRNGILYSGEWGGHCVSVIDAKDMSKLKTLKKVNLQGYGDGVWTYGNYLYVSTGHHLTDKSIPQEQRQGNGHGLEIFDITNPVSPKFISRTGFDNLYVRSADYWTPRPCSGGDYVLCADTFNGLYVVDAKDKGNLKTISRLQFKKENGKAAAVTSLAVGKGVVYLSVLSEFGLMALECPDVTPCVKEKGEAPIEWGYRFPYETSKSSHFNAWKPQVYSPVRGVAAYEKYLFAACSYGGLSIIGLDKHGRPVEKAKAHMKYAGDVKVKGNMLFVAEGFDGLAVYRIGKDLSLTEISRFNSFSKTGKDACLWVFTPNNKYVVASTRFNGYYYINIENLPEMKLVARLGSGPGWDKYVCDKTDSKGWYPSTRHKSGLFWVNLNEDKLKETKDIGLIPSLSDGVCRYKNDQFICCTKGEMYVFSALQINEEKSGCGKDLFGMPAWDGSNTMSLTRRMRKEIRLVDISKENDPYILWTEECDGYPETPVFWNGLLAVPCGYQGLLIQKR